MSRSTASRFEAYSAYLLIAPLFFFLIVFTFFPVFYSFYISLYHYDPFDHVVYFVGLSNYRILMRSSLFLYSLANVSYYTLIVVTSQTFLAMFLAILFNARLPATRIARAVVYLPAISSPVALSIIFIWVFSSQGLVNSVLAFLHFPHGLNYLYSVKYAFYAIMALNVFSTAPYFMLIYIAALQSIPLSVLEAASLDGVRKFWHRFRYIYFPMLRFSTILVVILGIVGSMQLFDQVFVMTQGGPGNATLVPLMFVYDDAVLSPSTLGIAAAGSFILFGIILVITVLQRNFFKELTWS